MVIEYTLRSGFITTNVLEWARLYEDPEYRNVAVDADIEEGVMVSTIWEGMHTLREGIYETAVLVDGQIQKTWRSHTESQAVARHNEVCQLIFKRDARPEDGLKERITEAERALVADHQTGHT